MANYDRATLAQDSVIGSMLIDDRCVPLVLSKLREEDFIDPTCRNFFRAIRELAMEGRPVDPVTVMGKLKSGNDYVQWAREVMEITPTAANVESYIPEVRKAARRRAVLDLASRLPEADDDELEALVRKMSAALSTTDRMRRMTGQERFEALYEQLKNPEKPKYLPWGIPTVDRVTYAELGDMILLGGYASSGKTLLSILMATAQAKAGYKVGYYSLETSPEKMTVRQASALGQISLERLKEHKLFDSDWPRLAEACHIGADKGSFPIMQAAGYTVDDITADALAHGYQVIYVDYVQLVQAPGVRATDRYAVVTAVSQGLKTFAQSTKTAVVALAQLSRPEKSRDRAGKPIPPSMHSFRESGQLEQDADAAFLVYPSNPDDNASTRVFKIGKNKEGPQAKVELFFRGDIQTMVELKTMGDIKAEGQAAKQANRAKGQAEYQELRGGDEDNPFTKK